MACMCEEHQQVGHMLGKPGFMEMQGTSVSSNAVSNLFFDFHKPSLVVYPVIQTHWKELYYGYGSLYKEVSQAN